LALNSILINNLTVMANSTNKSVIYLLLISDSKFSGTKKSVIQRGVLNITCDGSLTQTVKL